MEEKVQSAGHRSTGRYDQIQSEIFASERTTEEVTDDARRDDLARRKGA